jgi:hypothetical protein
VYVLWRVVWRVYIFVGVRDYDDDFSGDDKDNDDYDEDDDE